MKYSKIVRESAKSFRSRHLINNREDRNILENRCEQLLGGRSYCSIGIIVGNDFRNVHYNICGPEKPGETQLFEDKTRIDNATGINLINALYHACKEEATERLIELLKHGDFVVNTSNGDKKTFTNSLIVSENLVLHIGAGDRFTDNGYDLDLEIQKISNLEPHLGRNDGGQIYHFNRDLKVKELRRTTVREKA